MTALLLTSLRPWGGAPTDMLIEDGVISALGTDLAVPGGTRILDARGLLAWSPWDGKRPGGSDAARLVDGQWTQLGPSDQWPARIVHLVPLLDGSVLQIIREDDASGGGTTPYSRRPGRTRSYHTRASRSIAALFAE